MGQLEAEWGNNVLEWDLEQMPSSLRSHSWPLGVYIKSKQEKRSPTARPTAICTLHITLSKEAKE
ncbi:MAG: hypothetical protein RLZZ609_828 [Cyanobacteriota bacterium]|jgi:hypothetical protein